MDDATEPNARSTSEQHAVVLAAVADVALLCQSNAVSLDYCTVHLKNSRQYLLGCLDIIQPARRALVAFYRDHLAPIISSSSSWRRWRAIPCPLYWSHPVAAVADVALS
jgi:hypothetical protein